MKLRFESRWMSGGLTSTVFDLNPENLGAGKAAGDRLIRRWPDGSSETYNGYYRYFLFASSISMIVSLPVAEQKP